MNLMDDTNDELDDPGRVSLFHHNRIRERPRGEGWGLGHWGTGWILFLGLPPSRGGGCWEGVHTDGWCRDEGVHTYIRMVQEHNVQAFHSPHLVADGKPRDRDRGSDAQTGRMVGVPIRSLSSSPALIGEPLPLDQSDSSERSRWMDKETRYRWSERQKWNCVGGAALAPPPPALVERLLLLPLHSFSREAETCPTLYSPSRAENRKDCSHSMRIMES